jgi:transcription-repair coupling factor (superfamily II helicase)
LRDNRFANPAGLVELIQRHAGISKLRSDQKIVYVRDWHGAETRLAGAVRLTQALAKISAPPNPTPSRLSRRWLGYVR